MNYFTYLPEDIQRYIYKLSYDQMLENLSQSVHHTVLCFGDPDISESITKLSVYHLDLEATYTYTQTGSDNGHMYLTLGCWSRSPQAISEKLFRQHSKCNRILPEIFERAPEPHDFLMFSF